MRGNVALACGDCLGKLTDAGLHRSALACKGILPLPLGGHTKTGFCKIAGRLGLGITEQGDP